MAEANIGATLTARSALDPYAERFAALDGEVGIVPQPLARHLNLRIDTARASLEAVESALGTPLPGALSSVVTPDGASVLWLGPDEWLVIDPAASASLVTDLRAAVGDAGVVVDQSGQRVSLLVTGDAEGLLAKGTGLNLSAREFPEGTALQGFLAQAVVIFVSRSSDSSGIELVIRASFARYVADWLLDALCDPLAHPAAHGG